MKVIFTKLNYHQVESSPKSLFMYVLHMYLTDIDKKAELKPIPIPIPEPTYRSVSPISPNNPNPSADHKAVGDVPVKCQSEPRSKAKNAPTRVSKQTVTHSVRVNKLPKR